MFNMGAKLNDSNSSASDQNVIVQTEFDDDNLVEAGLVSETQGGLLGLALDPGSWDYREG
jgi:hypothetical protein